jgi:predicted PurR-regulated permease PerM
MGSKYVFLKGVVLIIVFIFVFGILLQLVVDHFISFLVIVGVLFVALFIICGVIYVIIIIISIVEQFGSLFDDILNIFHKR